MNTQRRQEQGGIFDEIKRAFGALPFVTKCLISATIGISAVGYSRAIDPYSFILEWRSIWKEFQIWRLITPFFFQPLKLSFLFNLYFLYTYSSELETGNFVGRTADYVFFILFQAVAQLVGAYFMRFILLAESLIISIMYLWSQTFRDRNVTFMFGLRFKAIYLPWVILVYDFFATGGIPYLCILGIITGHLYCFLEDTYPRAGGPRLLHTPQWLKRLFPPQRATGSLAGGFVNTEAPTARTFDWGRGRRLGE